MSKYNLLWEYVRGNGTQSFKLTFEEIKNIAGGTDRPFFSEIQKRTYGIWLSSRKNIYERADGYF